MKIRFWGVRGSIPVSRPTIQYYGGNTPCIEVESQGRSIILDAGSGLHELGLKWSRRTGSDIHIFLTHCHLDHLIGIPFFRPIHREGQTINIYGPKGENRNLRQIIQSLFSEEFFPVPFGQLAANLHFHSLEENQIHLGPFTIKSFVLNHPGHTLGYTVTTPKYKMGYLTDHEPIASARHIKGISSGRYEKKLRNSIRELDLLVHDAQYMDHEYAMYQGWGHSPWSYSVNLAEEAGIKKLVLYHHAPDSKDSALREELRLLKKKLKNNESPLKVLLACEGKTIKP